LLQVTLHVNKNETITSPCCPEQIESKARTVCITQERVALRVNKTTTKQTVHLFCHIQTLPPPEQRYKIAGFFRKKL